MTMFTPRCGLVVTGYCSHTMAQLVREYSYIGRYSSKSPKASVARLALLSRALGIGIHALRKGPHVIIPKLGYVLL